MIVRVVSANSQSPLLGFQPCDFSLQTGDHFELHRFERELLLFGDDDQVIASEPREWARVKINGQTVLEHVFPGAMAVRIADRLMHRMPDSFRV
jgi:hypothetical protein